MKKIIFSLFIIGTVCQTVNAQLSNLDVATGLKAALNKGVESATQKLSVTDGFFKNMAVKILIPPEAQKMEKTLRGMGFGDQVDKAILSMNRAAEDASKSAAPIFLNAVKQMTIGDAIGILKGGDSSATTYLRVKTSPALTSAFTPVIKTSLDKVDATKYWNDIVTIYNKVPFVKKINPDLAAYVTEKALSGLFYEIAQEEISIRKNPVERTSDILKKVFGGL
ncbi:MAG TPA: DUF4197 domain-containing protein [Chitinophagaceae bacterium]|nr:DUF4197 domain-containing protein [Chitinophagaceae bacterium]